MVWCDQDLPTAYSKNMENSQGVITPEISCRMSWLAAVALQENKARQMSWGEFLAEMAKREGKKNE